MPRNTQGPPLLLHRKLGTAKCSQVAPSSRTCYVHVDRHIVLQPGMLQQPGTKVCCRHRSLSAVAAAAAAGSAGGDITCAQLWLSEQREHASRGLALAPRRHQLPQPLPPRQLCALAAPMPVNSKRIEWHSAACCPCRRVVHGDAVVPGLPLQGLL